MRRLIQFIYYYRAFFTFLLFEMLAAWLIIANNNYQNAAFFNVSYSVAARIHLIRNNLANYFGLRQDNIDLAEENAFLRQEILRRIPGPEQDSSPGNVQGDSSLLKGQYDVIFAKVINNTIRRSDNFITVNKGTGDGIRPDMGVVSSWGIVGKVKACSEHFSVINSLLHSEMLVSSIIKRNNVLCTTQWTGGDPLYANLLYVPRHLLIQKGDTIQTSGYNAIFPENLNIGIIEDFSIGQNDTFYTIKIKLTTDFTSLKYVYIISNKFKSEKDTVEQFVLDKE